MAKQDEKSADDGFTRCDLEEDIVELRNGLAALDMMMLALAGGGVGNDEIVSRGIRFAQENMSSALNSLAKKVGLPEYSEAA